MSHWSPFTAHCSQFTVHNSLSSWSESFPPDPVTCYFPCVVRQMSLCVFAASSNMSLKSPFSYYTFTTFCTRQFSSILSICPNHHLNLLLLKTLMVLYVCVSEHTCPLMRLLSRDLEIHHALTPLIFHGF